PCRPSTPTCASTPTCRSWSGWRSVRTAPGCPASSSPPPTSTSAPANRRRAGSPSSPTRPTAPRWPRPARAATAGAPTAPAGRTPLLSLHGAAGAEPVEVLLPRFAAEDGSGRALRRGVPARRIGGHLVTTVFDLVMAQYGVARDGLPGDWPAGYGDPSLPYTP